jgi:2-phospho-L-lactate guanylyltransferase
MTASDKQALTWAMVPLKSRERAKSRLASVLSPEQRLRLFFALATRVIRTLQATRGIDAVAVITASTEVAAFAQSLGAVAMLQSADFGMSAAFDTAIRELNVTKPRRVLMLPGDLPLVSTSALEEVLAANTDTGVVIVPDRHRVGTNALLCDPPQALAPCFGGHSFERHLITARAAGVDVRVLEVDALALDLDNPEDLDYLRERDSTVAEHLLGALPCPGTTNGDCGERAALAVNQ